jgi:hypothetical protein
VQNSRDFGNAAEWFLGEFPDTEHGREAALLRTLSMVVGARPEDFDWDDGEPPPGLNCGGALEELDAHAGSSERDKWSAAALGFKALCLYEIDPEDKELIREAHGAYTEIPEPDWSEWYPFRFPLQNALKILSFRVDGPPEFTAPTLEGEEITLDKFRGNHLLLEFWAPG